MKVQKHTSDSNFNPITLSIIIESAIEYNALIRLAEKDISIPEQFDIEFQQSILDFLVGIRQNLSLRN